ncbi:MAG TPA: FUSC family protein [Candidatus Eisenbacteria bacterium]|nr:FUSC family protein [Candidatus Eisenbacteria bacterium]
MVRVTTRWSGGLNRQSVLHALRTSVVAVVSLLVAKIFRLPEAYWAPITTLVITQSSLGAALEVSWQRFVGTVFGAVVGAVLATYLGPPLLGFVLGVFMLGLICFLARSDLSAYRFGGVTLAIVLLIPRAGPPWQTAFHRFAEVSIGIVVALIFTLIWPEKEEEPSAKT